MSYGICGPPSFNKDNPQRSTHHIRCGRQTEKHIRLYRTNCWRACSEYISESVVNVLSHLLFLFLFEPFVSLASSALVRLMAILVAPRKHIVSIAVFDWAVIFIFFFPSPIHPSPAANQTNRINSSQPYHSSESNEPVSCSVGCWSYIFRCCRYVYLCLVMGNHSESKRMSGEEKKNK